MGNQTHAIEYVYSGSELQKTVTRQWRFGPKGRLEMVVEPEEKVTQYIYDKWGHLEALVKPDGRKIHYVYDSCSRLARYWGEGVDYVYTYDIKNRLTKVEDQIRKTALESFYDIYDNVNAEKMDSGIVFVENLI